MGGPAGNLFVTVQVEPDERFHRDGNDLVHELHVPFTKCCLGGEVEVPTLEDKPAKLTIAPGTQAGAILTVEGQGVTRLDGRGRGDLHCQIQIEVPTELSAKAKKLLVELQESLDKE
jgi:molecular chaperone DnaJ